MRTRLSGHRATAAAVAIAGALVLGAAAAAVAVSPEHAPEPAHDNGVREYPWFDEGAARDEPAPPQADAQDQTVADESDRHDGSAAPERADQTDEGDAVDDAVTPGPDATPPTLAWEHADAPTTRVEDRSVDVAWTYTDDVTTGDPAQTLVQLDDDAPEPWASSTWSADPDLDGLADGAHTLTVTASDEAGNWSDPLTFSWVQQPPAAAAPEVTLDAASWADDADAVTGSSVTFALFTRYDLGPEYGVETFYSLDGAAAERLDDDGDLTLDGLAAGSHTLSVHAVSELDGASAPLELTWVVTG